MLGLTTVVSSPGDESMSATEAKKMAAVETAALLIEWTVYRKIEIASPRYKNPMPCSCSPNGNSCLRILESVCPSDGY